MKFTKGEQVIYLPTGETARITKMVGDELAYIRMDLDKEEMPAFVSDIAPVLSDNRKKEEKVSQTSPAEIFYKDDLKEGLYLIVQYKMGQLNPESTLPVFIYNHSNKKINFDVNHYSSVAEPIQFKGKLEAGGIDLIHHISFESLEQSPTFEIDWSKDGDISTILQCDVTIKPAAFFKKHAQIAIINSTGSSYFLQPRNNAKEKDDQTLSGYTKAEKRLNPAIKITDPSKNLKAKASFDTVLDLHIDNIHSNPGKLKKSEILPYQLKIFDEYIEKAIRLGINQIFIVHGLGQGKLKNEITTRLMLHHGVNTFKNEFHPSYGFGATEVWLY